MILTPTKPMNNELISRMKNLIVFVVFMLPPASIYIGDSNLFRYPIYQYHEIGMKKESLSPRTMKTKLLM
jgi:hypothetical protein